MCYQKNPVLPLLKDDKSRNVSKLHVGMLSKFVSMGESYSEVVLFCAKLVSL